MGTNVVGIPTLTADGSITDYYEILKKQFEYFLACDHSQSNYFIGNIQSLKYILTLKKDPNDIAYAIKEALKALYASYFTSTTISINIDDSTSIVVYTIDVKAYVGTTLYEMSGVIDGTLANTNNYAEALANLIKKYYY